ncbi:hypothetical protein G9A89_002873 [Geosiphon pyriformis]|nr:hypothetical protein G9A89_002873 [Geosiphon pyriformis]
MRCGSIPPLCPNHLRTPCLYGENHSDPQTGRIGKSCDYLYRKSCYEIGFGENTGPKHKDHYEKAETDFIDLMKVAKSLHIQFKMLLIEKSIENPLPKMNGDLYCIYEWASEDLPAKDADVERRNDEVAFSINGATGTFTNSFKKAKRSFDNRRHVLVVRSCDDGRSGLIAMACLCVVIICSGVVNKMALLQSQRNIYASDRCDFGFMSQHFGGM